MDYHFLGECICFGIALFMGEMALIGLGEFIVRKLFG